MIEIISWQSFQSYKDRRPPWVRLHRSLLDNFEFQSMSADARAILPMLWLLASEDADPLSGCIRYSHEKIAFRLRLDTNTVTKALHEIRDAGFIVLNQSCTESVHEELRIVHESVTPETETETETETEKPIPARRSKKDDDPEGKFIFDCANQLGISPSVIGMLAKQDKAKLVKVLAQMSSMSFANGKAATSYVMAAIKSKSVAVSDDLLAEMEEANANRRAVNLPEFAAVKDYQAWQIKNGVAP